MAAPGSGADSGVPATLSDDTPAASSDCSQSVQVPLLLRRPGHSSTPRPLKRSRATFGSMILASEANALVHVHCH